MIRTLFLAALVVAAQANSQSPHFIPAPGSPMVIGKGPGQVSLADINDVRCQMSDVRCQMLDVSGRVAAKLFLTSDI
jgi:hypothetical protein